MIMKFWSAMKLRWRLSIGAFLIDGSISAAEYLYNSLNPHAFDNEYFDVWVQVWSIPHRPADWLGAYVLWPVLKFLIPNHYLVINLVLTIVAYLLEFAVVFWLIGWWIERKRMNRDMGSEGNR
jgi:hypothetical protein